jgi:hypothetical protein
MPVHIDEDGPVNLYTEPETCRYTLTCVEYVLFRTNPIPIHPSPLTPSFLFPPTPCAMYGTITTSSTGGLQSDPPFADHSYSSIASGGMLLHISVYIQSMFRVKVSRSH